MEGACVGGREHTPPSGPLFPPALTHSPPWGTCSVEVKGSELGSTPEFSFHRPETVRPVPGLGSLF